MSTVLTKVRFDAWPAQWVRKVRRRYNDQCINIVTYHSINAHASLLNIGGPPRHTPVEFERQIEYLASNYNVISLRALVESLERDEVPHRAVVITFDDGYADAVRHAMPILYRRRIPMTVFLVTSVVGNRDLLWQHKLAWLSAHGQEERVEAALRGAAITGREPGEPLTRFVRRCYRSDVPMILESVLRSVGKSGESLAAELRPYLLPAEIAAADADFVEFGNHTHTHPVLSALSYDEQTREISRARDEILSWTGRFPLTLAYPFGLKRHYNADSKRIAQETWHRGALDLRRRTNEGVVDPFELSRKPAAAGSQRLFEQLIEDWPTEDDRASGAQPPSAVEDDCSSAARGSR
jgi:peptidoglycan/xylan/chitin deacetylase (PgdA/CDA1 family)